MGSGDPSGLQNRRELASLALVSSTLTRFRHFHDFIRQRRLHGLEPSRARNALVAFIRGSFPYTGKLQIVSRACLVEVLA